MEIINTDQRPPAGAANGGLFDVAPGRLKRVVSFALELGRLGTPAGDALEEIQDAIWAGGLLPADRASQARAWEVTLAAARAAYDEGAGEAVATIARSVVAEADNGGDAVRATFDRACTFASDTDIANAVAVALAAAGRADEVLAAPHRLLRTLRHRQSEPDAHREEMEADEALELAEYRAERDSPEILAALPDGTTIADLAAALRAAQPLISEKVAEMLADHAIQRHAQPPQAQYQQDPVNPFGAGWTEPDDAAMALHKKAAAMKAAAPAIETAPINRMSPGELMQLACARSAGIASRHEPAVFDDPEEAAAIPTSRDKVSDLTTPPGLVGDIMDWMEDSSDRPNRALLLGAALTFVGTLAGRRYASPSNLRTNNYVVTLAPSGHGKDHALAQIKTLAAAARLDRFVGPARIMSASALRKLVAREPSVACFIDEFGGFMHQIHDRRAGIHNTMIRNDMLEMFSAAGSFFAGAEYAGEAASKVYAPNFSISGTSTPAQFWTSLSSMSAVDGLLARLVLLNVDGPKPARRKPKIAPREVPADLIAQLHRLADAHPRGNLADAQGAAPEPYTVPFDEPGELALAAFTEELDRSEADADEAAMPFINRAREHAIKLAMLVAVGANPETPTMSGPIVEWACRLARLSMCTLIAESGDRIADNDRAAAFNRLLSLVRDAGAKGITEGRMADKARGIDHRMRESILKDMIAAGRIRFERKAGTGGRPSERYFAA